MEGRLLEPRKIDPNSPANKILTALRETKATSSDVPFETSFAFFRATEGSIYIPILYEIDETPSPGRATRRMSRFSVSSRTPTVSPSTNSRSRRGQEGI